LRKMVLLRWSAGAVGAGSVSGGAVGGACFGVLRLGEGRVPSRDFSKLLLVLYYPDCALRRLVAPYKRRADLQWPF
jgi:hypothetical protein